ncbi:hypothetical protein [Azospirillum doebereinerae]
MNSRPAQPLPEEACLSHHAEREKRYVRAHHDAGLLRAGCPSISGGTTSCCPPTRRSTSSTCGPPLAVIAEPDRRAWTFFDAALGVDHAWLGERIGGEPWIAGHSTDRSRMVVFADRDDGRGHYWLFDRPSRRLRRLFPQREALQPHSLPPLRIERRVVPSNRFPWCCTSMAALGRGRARGSIPPSNGWPIAATPCSPSTSGAPPVSERLSSTPATANGVERCTTT